MSTFHPGMHPSIANQLHLSYQTSQVICSERAQNVECCFLLDATGSMRPYWDKVCDRFKSLVQDVRNEYPDLALHVAIVAYRDYGDRKPLEVLDFTTSLDDFTAFLSMCDTAPASPTPAHTCTCKTRSIQQCLHSQSAWAYRLKLHGTHVHAHSLA